MSGWWHEPRLLQPFRPLHPTTEPAWTWSEPGEGLQTLPSSRGVGPCCPPVLTAHPGSGIWVLLCSIFWLSGMASLLLPRAGHQPGRRRRRRGEEEGKKKNESPQKCLHNRKRLIKYLWFGMCDPTGQTMHLAGNPAINAAQSGIPEGLGLAGRGGEGWGGEDSTEELRIQKPSVVRSGASGETCPLGLARPHMPPLGTSQLYFLEGTG